LGEVEVSLTFEEAQRLLSKFVSPLENWYHHSIMVAQVALAIAEALEECGCPVSVGLVYVAALLHDIGRYKTHHPSLHGWEGYLLLRELGYPGLARVCLTHVLKGRTVQEAIQEGVFPRVLECVLVDENFDVMSLEEKVVALADIMVRGTEIVSIEERYQGSRRKYPDCEWLSENERRVKVFRDEIETLLGYPVYCAIADHGIE
jgi:uncharacterized protein